MESVMDRLSQSIAIFEEKYGKIDNIKFLLGEGSDMSKDTIFEEIEKVATGFKAGTVVPSERFDDSALLSA
jgi:hypothetical protein